MSQPRESYAVLPLSTVADAEALEGWMDGAAAGARVLVATGRVMPVAAPGWLLAKAWERQGLAAIVATRRGSEWTWVAERSAHDGAAVAARRIAGARAAEPEAPDGTMVSDCIFRTIKRHANMGLPAPTLAMLAKASGLKSPASARYWVGKLERRGLIEVEVKQHRDGERRRFHTLDSDGRRIRASDWSRPSTRLGPSA